MYPRYYYNANRGFVVPFLLGGLAGGAAISLTRPRPIYNVAPHMGGYYPNQMMPYYSSSYSYYEPMVRPYY